jgi:hypothetical protein
MDCPHCFKEMISRAYNVFICEPCEFILILSKPNNSPDICGQSQKGDYAPPRDLRNFLIDIRPAHTVVIATVFSTDACRREVSDRPYKQQR